MQKAVEWLALKYGLNINTVKTIITIQTVMMAYNDVS